MPTAAAGDRPLTVDDVVQKTALNAVLAIAVGIASAVVGLGFIGIIGGLVVGLVLALIIIFKQSTNKALVLGYSLAEGVALGSLTGLLESSSSQYAGIGFQAILGTAGRLHRHAGRLQDRRHPGHAPLTKMVIGAAHRRPDPHGREPADQLLRRRRPGPALGGPLAIIFSLVCIGIGAFMLLLDFDQADQAIKARRPRAKFAWYLAFGLMTTLVWLYIEILQLLSYFRQ